VILVTQVHMTMPVEPGHSQARPSILERGFRPFFFGAAVFAAVAIPLWVAMLRLGWMPPAALDGRQWHVHEMLFGFVTGVIGGFLLTAIPNWTGRLPISGLRLGALFGLWLAGRIAMLLSGFAPTVAAAIDSAFLIVLALVAWREVAASRNVRNLPVCAAVSILAIANVGFHVTALGGSDTALFERLGLGVVAVLLMLIGGRIVPSFTRNWMLKQKMTALPAAFDAVDKAAMLLGAAATLSWIALPGRSVTGVLFAFAAIGLAVRLVRWRGWATVRDPLVLVLHVGYGWLPVWHALMALNIFWPSAFDGPTAIHALTAGAAGTMTSAVMTRASLGHSGRPLVAGPLTCSVYVLIVTGAALRLAAPLFPAEYPSLIACSGIVWASGFGLFALSYAGILLRPRRLI
jgi:uncharacterized protein involved in response to NO